MNTVYALQPEISQISYTVVFMDCLEQWWLYSNVSRYLDKINCPDCSSMTDSSLLRPWPYFHRSECVCVVCVFLVFGFDNMFCANINVRCSVKRAREKE